MKSQTAVQLVVRRAGAAVLLGAAVWSGACGFEAMGPAAGPMASPSPLPPVPPAILTVSGLVSGDGQPLSDATVEVRTAHVVESAKTDASGRYSATLPGIGVTTLWVTAHHDRFPMQPCAVWFEGFAPDARLEDGDVELRSAGRSGTTPTPPAGRRNVSGTVYQFTPDGTRRVPGADVAWDLWSDDLKAWTRTDAAGRFTLCNLPAGQVQIVIRHGALQGSFLVESGDSDVVLFLE